MGLKKLRIDRRCLFPFRLLWSECMYFFSSPNFVTTKNPFFHLFLKRESPTTKPFCTSTVLFFMFSYLHLLKLAEDFELSNYIKGNQTRKTYGAANNIKDTILLYSVWKQHYRNGARYWILRPNNTARKFIWIGLLSPNPLREERNCNG